jgi:uncharacterized repeat protein (TIGR03806 family)
MSWKTAFALLLVADSAAQTVTHRWSFNSTGSAANGTVIPDLIQAAPATIVGTGAARNGSTIVLPGTTTGNAATSTIAAYLDLPNGIVSSKTHLTVEIWATVVSARNWQRLFDFGRMGTSGSGEVGNNAGSPGAGTVSRDNLMLSVSRNGVLNDQRLAARLDGAPEIGANHSLSTSTTTRYHYVATFQAGAGANPATGGRFTWYRNGAQVGFLDTNFRLDQIEDVNNWLGRSQYSNDSNANISYDEVRLYDHVLTPAQIAANTAAGPDANLPAPAVTGESLTMNHGGKARIDVLANDSGEIVPSSLIILQPPASGSASISADRSILYTHGSGTPAGDSFVYRVSNSSGQTSTGTVTISFSSSLKIPGHGLDVPASPPATSYSLVNALGTLTFNQPLCLATPPGETQRLFVCEKGGLLKVVPDVTAASPTASVFLNLPALLTSRGESIDTGSECGLLGLAFHPDYAVNRQFYIFYSVTKGGLRYQRVSRFLSQAANPNAADVTSPGAELILIEQRDEQNNHNGGDLHFGPDDGYLYISVGDEGSGNDDPTFNSQRINKDLFSGILRIDVDKKAGNVAPTTHAAIPTDSGVARFSIPVDNPFVNIGGGTWDGKYNGSNVSGSVRREFWATGLRNPWRMSFDTGTSPATLWCGDVGQGQREEINIIEKGGNYGWVYREALLTGPRTSNPPMPANFDTLYHSPPVHNYDRSPAGGISVTGGRVYRGTRISALVGRYVFADYGSGNIWAMNPDGSGVERLTGEAGIAGFGVDPSNQDLLLADLGDGIVRRLVATPAAGTYPATLSATGVFADLSDLSPSPGLVSYDVNLPFWSDHAIKRRWFVVPDGTSQFTWAKEDPWTLPAGTIWVKHFDLEMHRGVPASKKRIETRLLVKNADGAYGVSYRWNEAGTEANLVADAGVDFPLAVTENGTPAPQTWRIPSRAECMACHTPQAGHALSFNTRQLNLAASMNGTAGNQLSTLFSHGFLANNPGSPNLLPRHVGPDEEAYSVEARVRSYLAVNCAYCHQSGGTAPTSWDGSADLTLTQTALVNGNATNNGGNPANKLVVPGSAANSILLHRSAATAGFTRMPPLGSNVIDSASVALLTQWISGELAARQTYDAWRSSNFVPADDPAGAPGEDPDGDGVTNYDEFLAGTHPRDGSSAFRPQISGQPRQLRFELPVNRSFLIETSTTLGQWTPWDIPGNEGLPVAGGLIEFTLPPADPLRFFRIELREN